MPLPSFSEILEASEIIYKSMKPTPECVWPLLSQHIGAEVWVKHENYTPIGAFKIRGGLNYLHNIKRNNLNVKKIIAATRGNHGQSIAYSAGLYGLTTTIVVPIDNSPVKNMAMRNFGATLIEHGKDFQDSLEYALKRADETGHHLIPSFHHYLVAGVATYALEFFNSVKSLDVIYIPIGLGSGICGTLAVRNALGLKTEVVGVVSKGAPAYALSFKNKRLITTETSETLADGIACRTPAVEALDYILSGVERIITVSDDDIMRAIGIYFTYTKNVAEPAAAAPLAALLAEKKRMTGKRVGLVLSGSNIDSCLYQKSMSLLST
tara:strand:- start:671 stop:1639 length:969 start_codon:yes stop_codon:yes gene_type:complete